MVINIIVVIILQYLRIKIIMSALNLDMFLCVYKLHSTLSTIWDQEEE